MKPIGYFCNNTPVIANLIGEFGDRLELMNKAGRHGLRLALAGKVYGFETGVYSSSYLSLTLLKMFWEIQGTNPTQNYLMF